MPPGARKNRREFASELLAGSLAAGGAGLGAAAQVASGKAGDTGNSRVVIAADEKLGGARVSADAAGVLRLLDRAMQACCRTDTAVEAWKQVVRPGEVVGLKVNCLAGRTSATAACRPATTRSGCTVGLKNLAARPLPAAVQSSHEASIRPSISSLPPSTTMSSRTSRNWAATALPPAPRPAAFFLR